MRLRVATGVRGNNQSVSMHSYFSYIQDRARYTTKPAVQHVQIASIRSTQSTNMPMFMPAWLDNNLSGTRADIEWVADVFCAMTVSIPAVTKVVLIIPNLSALDELSFGEVPLLPMRHVL